MTQQPNKVRNIFFTLNNYTEDQYTDILSWTGQNTTYYIICKETAPTTGTKHLHGYLEFENPRSWKLLHRRFYNANMAPRKKPAEACRLYCMKGGDYIEEGEISRQGSRSDIELVRGILRDHDNDNNGPAAPMRAVTAQATSFQSIRLAECYLKYHERKRHWKPMVKWFYGPTGSGKTREAMKQLTEPFIWSTPKWWDGYDAHKHVLIDDFRKDFCSFHKLLRILDRYPETVETKGGSRQLLARLIIITAPYPPTEMFEGSMENIDQVYRRLDTICKFNADGTQENTVLS